MRNVLSSWFVVLFLSALVVSCGEDEDTYTLSNNCYISSVTLGYTTRAVHVIKADGTDSTYSVALNGKYYPMTVDQRERLIYNEDSLPHGTRTSAILATFSCEGYVTYRPADDPSAEWIAYSSTDSIDFSTPLSVMVVSLDGTAYREYTLKVNVHQQDADDFTWKQMASADALQGMERMKAAYWNGRLLVLGEVNGGVKAAVTELTGALDWTLESTTGCEGADLATLQNLDGQLYLNRTDGTLLASGDGVAWEEVGAGPVDRLVAVGSRFLYALMQGQLYRSEDGAGWSLETLDDVPDLLPAQEIAAVCYQQTNGNERILLLGSRDAALFPADTATVVWSKTWTRYDDEGDGAWMFFNASPDNKYLCPQLKNLSVFRYDNLVIACGGASLDGKHQALDAFYVSSDNGITWKTDEVLAPPSTLKGTTEPVTVAVDANHFIWLVCGTEVWRGRLNRLGFAKEE